MLPFIVITLSLFHKNENKQNINDGMVIIKNVQVSCLLFLPQTSNLCPPKIHTLKPNFPKRRYLRVGPLEGNQLMRWSLYESE
jgi:hypothetical protein